MSDRILPNRRTRREAEGYLKDLFATDDVDGSLEAAHLLDNAHQVKVQRATNMLVMYFDLDDEGDGSGESPLPPATEGEDGPREFPGTGMRMVPKPDGSDDA